MANPSTIWAQLSIPNPPAGSVPFVASDGVTIVTDVVNFFYNPTTFQLSLKYQITHGYTLITTPAVIPVTMNTPTGRVVIANGHSSVTVNNSLVGTNTIILPVLETVDATATNVRSVVITPGVGFVINLTANATANVTVSFVLVN